ncbi:MFS transporter [Virgisporangium aurantiacum]|uniref:MFS transporter n=1 Tax=Virgisporangium aurantiacum TaxID=175570 RepID=A0A8J3ZAT0_9ACTN|nr:MFS transporter [Virgisporangium aurantiacum]GIJ59542.1 MFS transporter [Virgisporangium aurantiacum]
MGALLRANPGFRLLWTARTASYVGDSLGLVALLIYLEMSTGQALAVAFLLIAADSVPGLFGPLTGVVSDRFDLRRVLVGCDVAQGVLTLAIAVLLPPLPVLLLLVCLRGIAAQVFQPAARSAVPVLVADKDLETANSTLGAGTFGLEVVGPLLAAALLPVLDTRGLLFVDAATFAVSAVLLARLPALPRAVTEGEGTRAGLAYIRRAPVVRAIGLGFVAVVAFSGVDDVALVFLARDDLGAGDAATALLYAGIGIGLAAGYPLIARFGARTGSAVLIVAGFGISSAGNLLTGLAWAVGAALALQTVRGLGVAAIDVGVNTHLQRVVPADLQGRVFGTLYGAIGVAAGLSYALGGALLALTDARVTFVVAGIGGLLATAATAVALRAARQH